MILRGLPFIVLAVLVQPLDAQDRYTAARAYMVREYIAKEGIRNERVLQAMRTVPRHEFVRPADRKRAYLDGAWPIGYKQTISPPFVVAYMTETIEPHPADKVLEIGTGSGYQAAVLSGLVREVYTIEIVEPLGRSATRRLKRLDYDNVHTKVGDGYKGWPEHAPFDKIIVTCSPEKIPQPLVDQLKDGGKMIIPVGQRYQQVFHLLEKRDGKLVQKKLISTLFVPMTGISEKNREKKPDPLNPVVVNGGFEIDANDDGKPDGWHYQRQLSLVSEGAQQGKRCICFQNFEPGRFGQALQGRAIDGTKIGSLKLSVKVRYENTSRGGTRFQQPGLLVHFYDAVRRPAGSKRIGGIWLGNSRWREVSGTIDVPIKAKEMIFQVGLNGATGKLCVDDLKMEVLPRK